MRPPLVGANCERIVTKVLELSEKHSLSVEALTMTYPHGDRLLVALQGVSLEVKRGEFVCIVGASGSGKSTLLNLLAGLEQPTRGRAHAHGHVALIFQEAALLPWLTAAGNVELALELRGVRNPERSRIAGELLRRVHLDGWERRRPHELSGGMKQRVALARALAQDADVLLMDEPFAALDAITRDLLHEELERLWSQNGLTILFVTHNAREAVRLGDRVLVFTSRPGRVGHEVVVDLPRPRSLDSPDLAVIAGRITDRLKHEMRTR
jgi:NitT/TauT family transport system ATP-binding protein